MALGINYVIQNINPNWPQAAVGNLWKKLSPEGRRKGVEKKAPWGLGLEPGTYRVLGEGQ